MELSGGLTPSLHAYFIDPRAGGHQVISTEQDIAFSTEETLLTDRQIEIQQCVSVVVAAFNKACSGMITDESIAVLEAAYKKDEEEGRASTRNTSLCAGSGAPPPSGYSPQNPGTPRTGPNPPSFIKGPTVPFREGVTAPSAPAVVAITSSAPTHNLPTQGGDLLFLKVQGLTLEYGFRAYFVDESGKYDPINVRGGMSGNEVIQPVDYTQGMVFGNLTLTVPPGQGKQRRLILESDARFSGASLRSDGGQTEADTIGYA